ncbi:TrmH family RNA methyltransferase [Gulosibacter faecalis]|jgi:TrmH family RNA methyltransferase|uniref:TrmH family RNA methyltransferase n=1 Tax=Gulosibacter faecalis TaxID=272240 RepID=A0ABW5V2F0_9MICO|nr:TrmH family RNA methyltransferase [Gulosibacter faecalis]
MIESAKNQRVRDVRRLSQKNARTERGEFVIEGPQAVREALLARPDLVTELFATPTALERHGDVADLIRETGHEVVFASEEAVAAMSDTRSPQGIVAVARQFPTALKRVFEGAPKLVAILEEVRDPGNLGTIIRVADAAGADAVVLTGRTVDLYNPKVVRASTGSIFHLPIAVEADFDDAAVRAKQAGMRVLAADISGRDLVEARELLAEPTAWVFGNEAHGLPDEVLAQCDDTLIVPIYGRAESMNLATAASVCLYETAFSQRGR